VGPVDEPSVITLKAPIFSRVTETVRYPGAEDTHHWMLQTIHRGKGVDPKLQASGFDEILSRAEGGADQTTGFMHTGTARGEIGLASTQEGGTELLGSRQRRHLERGFRGLIGHTEVPASLAIVPPAR
jgi:hypothetical protein